MNALLSTPPVTERRGDFCLSTDPGMLDIDAIHGFLTESYWAKGISKEVVRRSVENSLCFAVYQGKALVAFARVISDLATFAYIGDVFVLEAFRGQGLSKWLMQAITSHPQLQGLRRWCLLTRDAHDLYAKFGFTPLSKPDRYMELHNPTVYQAVHS